MSTVGAQLGARTCGLWALGAQKPVSLQYLLGAGMTMCVLLVHL